MTRAYEIILRIHCDLMLFCHLLALRTPSGHPLACAAFVTLSGCHSSLVLFHFQWLPPWSKSLFRYPPLRTLRVSDPFLSPASEQLLACRERSHRSRSRLHINSGRCGILVDLYSARWAPTIEGNSTCYDTWHPPPPHSFNFPSHFFVFTATTILRTEGQETR